MHHSGRCGQPRKTFCPVVVSNHFLTNFSPLPQVKRSYHGSPLPPTAVFPSMLSFSGAPASVERRSVDSLAPQLAAAHVSVASTPRINSLHKSWDPSTTGASVSNGLSFKTVRPSVGASPPPSQPPPAVMVITEDVAQTGSEWRSSRQSSRQSTQRPAPPLGRAFESEPGTPQPPVGVPPGYQATITALQRSMAGNGTSSLAPRQWRSTFAMDSRRAGSSTLSNGIRIFQVSRGGG